MMMYLMQDLIKNAQKRNRYYIVYNQNEQNIIDYTSSYFQLLSFNIISKIMPIN